MLGTKTKKLTTYRVCFRKKKIQGRKQKTRELTGTFYIFKLIWNIETQGSIRYTNYKECKKYSISNIQDVINEEITSSYDIISS